MWGFLFTKINLCKEGIYFQLRANLWNELHFEHNKCNEWLQHYSTGAASPQTPQLPPLVETVLGWRRGSEHGLWVAWELPSAWPRRRIRVFWRVPPFSIHKSFPVPLWFLRGFAEVCSYSGPVMWTTGPRAADDLWPFPELLALQWGESGLSSALGLLVVCLGKKNEQQSQNQSTCWYSTNIDNIHQVSV